MTIYDARSNDAVNDEDDDEGDGEGGQAWRAWGEGGDTAARLWAVPGNGDDDDDDGDGDGDDCDDGVDGDYGDKYDGLSLSPWHTPWQTYSQVSVYPL